MRGLSLSAGGREARRYPAHVVAQCLVDLDQKLAHETAVLFNHCLMALRLGGQLRSLLLFPRIQIPQLVVQDLSEPRPWTK